MMNTTQRARLLRGAVWGTMALLGVVFLLGMNVNLYMAFPANLPVSGMQLAAHTPVLQTHMIAGVLALVAGLVALGLSLVERNVWAIGATLAGFALALVAFGGGMMFLTAGFQNSASMMMATGFIGAFAAYAVAACAAAPRLAPASAASARS